MSEPVKGPKSYFPSIEAKYGQPIEHWMSALGEVRGLKHLEQVNWLKNEPIVIASGEGAALRDVKGREYLDANSSIWTNLHGHNHPKLNIEHGMGHGHANALVAVFRAEHEA